MQRPDGSAFRRVSGNPALSAKHQESTVPRFRGTRCDASASRCSPVLGRWAPDMVPTAKKSGRLLDRAETLWRNSQRTVPGPVDRWDPAALAPCAPSTYHGEVPYSLQEDAVSFLARLEGG